LRQFGWIVVCLASLSVFAQEPATRPAPTPIRDPAELAARIARDFRLSQAELTASLAKSLRDFKPEELEAWIAEGLFDVRDVGGERRFHASAKSNLFFRKPALNARRIDAKPDLLGESLEKHADLVVAAAKESGERFVLPQVLDVDFRVEAKADAVRDGATVRAWIPIARRTPWQGAGEVLEAAPKPLMVAPQDADQRSAYCESRAVASRPTAFRVVTRQIVYAVAPPGASTRPTATRPALDDAERTRFLAEKPPHVVFSPALRALSASVVGDEKDPAKIARRLYDWIGDHVVYSYAREYSTLSAVAEECAATRRGDCGQIALLFIALCRLNGVPARWQSGWAAWPGAETMHDWAEIWTSATGWAPVDPFMSVYAATQPPARKAKLRDFFFGGLDGYRFVVNGDHGAPLVPDKPSWRSDDVDFQRGELEADGANLYYDRFAYDVRFTFRPLP
jgi:hypothetical protein